MPWPRALLALLLVLSSGPAWAVKDWYDFYEEGKLQAGRGLCKEALANLAQARRLKPGSELQARLYGLVFDIVTRPLTRPPCPHPQPAFP